MTRKVFDKSLPPLPPGLWASVGGVFDITEAQFERAAWAAGETAKQEFPDPNDRMKLLSGSYSVGGQLAVMQDWVTGGERIIAVDPGVLGDAENTDCLQSINGEDLKQTFPSFALWFPRRVRDTMSHFQLVRHYAAEDLRSDPGSLEYLVAGKRRVARFRSCNGLAKNQKIVGLIAATQFHSYESTAGTPLVSIDGTQGIACDHLEDQRPELLGRGMPKEIRDTEVVRSDRGILETLIVPIYSGMSLLDCFCSTLYADEAAKMRRMYIENGEPQTPMELSRQGFLTTLNVLSAMMTIMSSYPEYLQSKTVRLKGPKPGNPKKKKITNIRIEELRPPVAEEKPAGGRPLDPSGSSKRSHWRRGHWRRQAHAENWRRSNRDRSTVRLPDGREAHLTWIKPLWIGGNQ